MVGFLEHLGLWSDGGVRVEAVRQPLYEYLVLQPP